MSIDILQNKIRKMKNPAALWLCPSVDQVPPAVQERSETPAKACGDYCLQLLEALCDSVPAVRVSFDAFAILGPEGLEQLQLVLQKAKGLGFYVILDWQHLESGAMAEYSAKRIFCDEIWPCDGLTLSSYGGSEAVKPYLQAAGKKSAFITVKTGNKSGSELQDLQTGGRMVYMAAADLITRWGETAVERCGYSRVAAVAGAVNSGSLRTLRQKYPKLFLLVDGLEVSGANAKNCSYAFDKLGHGALVCAGSSILAAWQEREDGDYIAAAKDAAERLKRNLTRYVTVL